MNLRPATLPELLAFGAKYPDKQKEFPIMALGSVWIDPDGDRRVHSLGWVEGERELHLGWDKPGYVWGDYCRFLAVSK